MSYSVQNIEEIPYMQCKTATIRPLARGEHAGTFEANGEEREVRIVREVDAHGEVTRVWARVPLCKAPEGAIDELALEVAQRSTTDPAWTPVKIDLRDGEAAYMKTWTRGFPSDGDMDEFIMYAKAFIQERADLLGKTEAGEN